ncbi:unnamed protein product [Leuciscus chuanchicus]
MDCDSLDFVPSIFSHSTRDTTGKVARKRRRDGVKAAVTSPTGQTEADPCESTEGEEASRRNYSRRNYGHTIVKMEIKEEPCRIKDEDTEEQIDLMEVNEDKPHRCEKPNFTNEDVNSHFTDGEEFTQKQTQKTELKGSFTQRFKEEPCRIKDEHTEEQIDPMKVSEEKQHFTKEDGELTYKNKDKKHLFHEPHHFKNKDGNAVVSKTEENITQKQAGKSGVKGSFTCSECGKSFIYKSDFNEHMMIHTGEKPFSCSLCGKSYRHKGHLNVHMKVHTGEKPFTCTQCGKSFISKRNLNYHLLRHSGLKSFSCDQCEKTFVLASGLQKHLKVHTAVKPHFCSFCGKSFSIKQYLKDHERIHAGVRPYVCVDCGKSFITSSNLKSHQRIHTGEKPYKCSHCGKSFRLPAFQRNHTKNHCPKASKSSCSDPSLTNNTPANLMEVNEDKPHRCQKPHFTDGEEFTQKQTQKTEFKGSFTQGFKEEPCRIKDEDTEEQIDPVEVNEEKQRFTTEDGELTDTNKDKKHLFHKTHHFKNEDGNAVVSKTEENFPQKQAGKSGVKGSFTCSECGKSFIYKSDFNGHMMIHTGEKPFTCSLCGKSYRHKGHLNVHMKVHTGEKPFTCSQCGKSFISKRNLNYHLLRHSGLKSFSCDQCEKTFVSSSSLREHLIIHTGLKPHFCSFCGKSFSLKQYLKVHERIHTGVRPYVCVDCGKSFITSSTLNNHKRIHTGEKP